MKKVTKRIFATMLAALMLLGTLPAMMLYAANEVFILDFEDEKVATELITPKNVDTDNTVTVDVDPKDPNNKVLNISKTNSKKKPYALIKLPDQSGSFTVEYRIMFNSTGQCAAVVQSGTANTAQGAYLVSRAKSDDTTAAALENCTGGSNWNMLLIFCGAVI